MIDQILRAWDPSAPAVLGTLVDLQGSGYRRPGARILIRPDGTSTGTISGGCLERDVARSATRWAAAGPATVAFDTRRGALGEPDLYGSGCEGVVHLFLEPITPERPVNALRLIADARASGEGCVLATVYHCAGRLAGLEGLGAFDRGQGPELHARFAHQPEAARLALVEAMAQVRAARQSQGVRLDHADGALRALVEWVAPPRHLVIAGTGPDAEVLAHMARPLGWRVDVWGVDDIALGRLAAAGVNARRLPPSPTGAELSLTPHSAVVLMTHNLARDAMLLPVALESAAPYVGLLGPRARAGRLMARLLAEGRVPPAEALARLATPIGLDIGGSDPTTVALSILGQITARAHQRPGAELVGGRGHIHPPHPVTQVALSASPEETSCP